MSDIIDLYGFLSNKKIIHDENVKNYTEGLLSLHLFH